MITRSVGPKLSYKASNSLETCFGRCHKASESAQHVSHTIHADAGEVTSELAARPAMPRIPTDGRVKFHDDDREGFAEDDDKVPEEASYNSGRSPVAGPGRMLCHGRSGYLMRCVT